MEHFGLDESPDALKAIAAHSLGHVIRFIDEELFLDEHDDLEEIRSGLSKFEKYTHDRLASIEGELENTDHCVVMCLTCFQNSAIVEEGYSCLFCGFIDTPESALEEIVDLYSCTVHSCPSCSEMFLLHDREEFFLDDSRYVCLKCGDNWQEDELAICESCEAPFETKGRQVAICPQCAEGLDRITNSLP
jgi:hypothetical protein